MRDNNKGMPEIVSAFRIDKNHFIIIGIEINNEKRYFRIGVTQIGYNAIKNILGSRPFDQMPGVHYQYYFCGTSSCVKGDNDDTPNEIGIRVECAKNAKNITFHVPKFLLQNLEWFMELKNFDEIFSVPQTTRDGELIMDRNRKSNSIFQFIKKMLKN